jgi:hypothetical protein
MAYGGGINVQQSGSKLIMNGGLVKGNTANGMGPRIAVNKGGDCYFEMNGGIVDNCVNGVLLFNNRISILTNVNQDNDCNGRLILNKGTVSGVTINSLVNSGTNTPNQYRNLYITDKVDITTGYVAVGGKMQSTTSTTNTPWNVTLLPAYNFDALNIGNPNKSLYPMISAALPNGWTMPSTTDNVIAFWMKKTGSMTEFSVPVPTSVSGGANYNVGLKYFAAVLENNAAGAAAGTTVKLYPTRLEGGQIIVSVPLSEYLNGATVALVQPSSAYGLLEFEAPTTLTYNVGTTAYPLTYTGEYDISLLIGELIDDGHTESNTFITMTIHPDSSTPINPSNFDIASSDIFELAGTATWDLVNWELFVPMKLKTGWNSATDRRTEFTFDCTLAAADFVDDSILYLTGELEIKGNPSPPNHYLILGNYAETELIIPQGNLNINKKLSGDATDVAKIFHFIVTFSDGDTYAGVESGITSIPLKGGESRLITGIPQGVTYTVVEVEANQGGYINFKRRKWHNICYTV